MANRAVSKAHEARSIRGTKVKQQPSAKSSNASRASNANAGRTVSNTSSGNSFNGRGLGYSKGASKATK